MAEIRRWLAHVCTHPACWMIEFDHGTNLSQYLCYASQVHEPGEYSLRPIWLCADEIQPTPEQARAMRERNSGGLWRRPSQHFARDPVDGRERLTEPLPDEDWPGWPDYVSHDPAAELRGARQRLRGGER